MEMLLNSIFHNSIFHQNFSVMFFHRCLISHSKELFFLAIILDFFFYFHFPIHIFPSFFLFIISSIFFLFFIYLSLLRVCPSSYLSISFYLFDHPFISGCIHTCQTFLSTFSFILYPSFFHVCSIYSYS